MVRLLQFASDRIEMNELEEIVAHIVEFIVETEELVS